MTDIATASRPKPGNFAPAAVGFGSLVAFLLLCEWLIRASVISRFIVPPPSEIIGSFTRLIVE
jgi:ABC-type nitrate/sulfonate/bicarbonate transport system permease component